MIKREDVERWKLKFIPKKGLFLKIEQIIRNSAKHTFSYGTERNV